MVKDYQKYINKRPDKDKIDKILKDILENNMSNYDVIRMQWKENVYRLRKWKIRILFLKWKDKNEILRVAERWEVYKN